MTKKLTGQPALAYLGVNAPQPPNIIRETRRPTANDCQNFNLGDMWLYHVDTPPVVDELWMYIRRYPNRQALWVQLNSTAGVEVIGFHTDAGDALPDPVGYVTVAGGSNMNTSGAVNTITVNLNHSIFQPATTADQLNGVYGLNGDRFLHGYNGNLFAGFRAGNYTLTATNCVGLGADVLPVLSTGIWNTIVGAESGSLMTTSSGCTSCGYGSLSRVVTGSFNSAFGQGAGEFLTGADHSNILIGHGGIAGSTHRMFLGTDGVGLAQINETYIAGVYERIVDNGTLSFVVIDNATKMGSYTFASSDHTVNVTINDGLHTVDFTTGGGVAVAWTPVLMFSGAAVGITYSAQTGSYVRIGNVIYYQGHLTLTSKGSSAGVSAIHGLPFPSAIDTIGTLAYSGLTSPIDYHDPCTILITGNDYLIVSFANSTAGTNLGFTLNNTSCTNLLSLWVSGFYFV